MKRLFNFGLSTPKSNDILSMEDIMRNVHNTVRNFILNNKMAPDVIRVIITCTYLQYRDIVKRAFYGSVDALHTIAKENFHIYLPTLDVSLQVILDQLKDKGPMKIRTICENQLIPNIVTDKDSTSTNVNYQSIEPYFNKERLHFIAREFNPETNEMTIRWNFSENAAISTNITFKIAITNSGIRFKENHASEYIITGNDDNFTIQGAGVSNTPSPAGNILHIDGVATDEKLLAIRFNYTKGFWEYKICSDTTIINGQACYASDNYVPLDDSIVITVVGIALYLEPIGKPRK